MKFYAVLTMVCALALALPVQATEYVVDDFDGGQDSRVTVSGVFGTTAAISPDNSGNLSIGGAPGAFPSSGHDLFGRTNRIASFDIGDDSLDGVGNPNFFEADTLGITPFEGPGGHDASNHFFATNDVDNGDNEGGGGTAVWTIDISGLSNLSLTTTFSAMGDFEAGDNSHVFTATIDGGSEQTLFVIDANATDYRDGNEFVYTMEAGAEVAIQDPLEITDDAGTRVIDNSFTTTGTSSITGTGSVLTITYTAGANNGGNEPFGFDDLILSDEVIVGPVVDLDDDGDVDGADFLAIQSADPSLIAAWESQYGDVAGLSGVSAVPEPTSLMLFSLAAVMLPMVRRQRA